MLKIEKYLYLIAFGGLNDTINQIMFGYNHCIQYKRILVVDTKHSRQEKDIQNYFDIKNKIIFQYNKELFIKHSKSLSIYPNCDISLLEFNYSHELGNMLHKGIFFNIDLNRKEDVLIYGNCRLTGKDTNKFFKIFPMKQNVIYPLKKRFSILPIKYTSVHIRNTDYKSDIPEFINKYKKKLDGKDIFLASDNTESIDEFKKQINGNVYTFSNIPKYINDPKIGIHKYKVDNKEDLNVDSIIDLILLALGEEIFCSCPHSGYSINATTMNADYELKENILNQLKQSGDK